MMTARHLPSVMVAVAMLPFASVIARAATIHVPADYPSIQAALDAAADGDTVLVADGVYTGEDNRHLAFGGKAVVLRSENGAEHCTIDAGDRSHVFYFNNSGEGPDCVVDGFTITGGMASSGGGLCVTGASPTVRNCLIRNNRAFGRGGGIYLNNSDTIIEHCLIVENRAEENEGGGVYFGCGQAVILDCTISGNHAEFGGGVYVRCHEPDTATLRGCVIRANTASLSGGGVFAEGGHVTIADCTISANASLPRFGGGFACCCGPEVAVTNCQINENTGAGIYIENANATFANCAVGGNTAFSSGAVVCYDSSAVFTNCTVSDNVVNFGSGSALWADSSTLTITNCVLRHTGSGNQAIEAPFSELAVSYSDIQGGWPGEGNIDADPQLAFAGDAHLMPTSPCVDAGTNNPPGGLPADGLDGNPRPLDGDGDGNAIADMGAFELHPETPTIALDPARIAFTAVQGGPNPPPGALSLRNCAGGTLNWQIAGAAPWLGVIPTAGASSGEVHEVVLAADTGGLDRGVYTCTLEVSADGAVNSPRYVDVELRVIRVHRVPSQYHTIQAAIDAATEGDVVLVADGTYTGSGNKNLVFAGKAITVRSENGPNHCIIDCEGDGRGLALSRSEGSDTIVRGFTITGGNLRGGGILVAASSATIIDCTITGNAATADGGGVHITGSPTFVNCRIVDNSTPQSGGGIACRAGEPLLINCLIAGNSAQHEGGGISCYRDAWVQLYNCTVTGNAATTAGGVFGDSDPGGAMLVNSIVWNNVPQEVIVESGDLVVRHCDIRGGPPGEGNLDADPLFVDPDGPDNDPNTWQDNDFRLSAGSPCIDAGDDTSVPPDQADLDRDGDRLDRIPVDLDQRLRFADDPATPDTGLADPPLYPRVVDMGAYEVQLLGDLDGDGDVDLDDLAVLLIHYAADGVVYADGDLDGDGDVDLSDLALMLGVYGAGG